MFEPQHLLGQIGTVVRDRFESEKRVLSMEEYLALFSSHPGRFSRDAARYLRDAFDHFGTEEVSRPTGSVRRFSLFDQSFEEEETGAGRAYLVGQEQLQNDFYLFLENFVREGRVNRLILLHGPNGSAKSTFVDCLMRGLENYSQCDEGAIYRFSWIFPRGSDGKTVGFGSRDQPAAEGESYAHLEDHHIDVKLVSEIRENPLLLLPRRERRLFMERAYRDASMSENAPKAPPRLLLRGELGHKNRTVFEALLAAYKGDLSRVLAHVRVERFYHSKRYRVGAISIGPEMAVDAQERQITADRSLGALPASLSSLPLFETTGDLVDASGGLLEFSDLLKRPVDAWRYLLGAIETGQVSLSRSTLPINAVLTGTSNELHLGAFKEHHEYKSFRGRLQLVRVPYLRNYLLEQEIYDAQIVPQVRQHVAPHATRVAALWATLTRLRQPQEDNYEGPLAKLATGLSPLEKAELYATGRVPRRFSTAEAMELRTHIDQVQDESNHWPRYEGSTGASPREIRNILLEASQNPEFSCLSPIAVLRALQSFCESDDYDYLKEKAEGGYHAHREFVNQAGDHWLTLVDDEFRSSTGLLQEDQHFELFKRYVSHVSYWLKGERLENPLTGDFEDPDQELMKAVEGQLQVDEKDREDFRKHLISVVAAHAIDHPGEEVNLRRVFPRHLERLREASYAGRRKQLASIAGDVLLLLSTKPEGFEALDESKKALARSTIATLKERFGYQNSSAGDAVGELLRQRYAPEKS